MVPGTRVSAIPAPHVSVCIANFNGEAMLVDCIESLLTQEPKASIEILVHDDASRDGSVALLRSRYPQVRVLESAENVGFCIGNNRMVNAACGEYVLLLNNDAALLPDAIAELLSAAERIGMPAILSLPQRDWETGTLVDRGCLLDPFHTPVPNLDVQRHDVAYVIGACLWIPRATWHELGGFPEWFGSIAEDMYLCCAARLRGVPVRCIDASGYRHRQGASFGGNRIHEGLPAPRYLRRYLSERNRLSTAAVCTPRGVLWPWLGLHALSLAAEGVLLSAIKGDARPWTLIYKAALLDVWGQRHEIRALRNFVQSHRRISTRAYWRAFSPSLQKLTAIRQYGVPDISF